MSLWLEALPKNSPMGVRIRRDFFHHHPAAVDILQKQGIVAVPVIRHVPFRPYLTKAVRPVEDVCSFFFWISYKRRGNGKF